MGNEKNKKSRQGKLGGASSVAKRKGGVDDEADVRKKKKGKTNVLDREEEGEISEDDCGLLGDIKVDVGLLGDIKPDVAFTALVATLSLSRGRVVLVEALGVTGLDVLQCSD
ncbi:hypothetical protein F2Q69_00026999 [Brassica cretica]|uniref:Uncharacterized protein n=1 Tax=Brassica cretica TaxID=69181 RepID=A0A8S9RVS4_BRACR|nr:hypothetical protein F2Q69_00026999 [Brassica cretica]